MTNFKKLDGPIQGSYGPFYILHLADSSSFTLAAKMIKNEKGTTIEEVLTPAGMLKISKAKVVTQTAIKNDDLQKMVQSKIQGYYQYMDGLEGEEISSYLSEIAKQLYIANLLTATKLEVDLP